MRFKPEYNKTKYLKFWKNNLSKFYIQLKNSSKIKSKRKTFSGK